MQNNRILERRSKTCLLHGDYSEDNVIATNEQVVGVIDFGDLAVGSPMEDFSRMYINHYGTKKFEKILEGYGKSFEMDEI